MKKTMPSNIGIAMILAKRERRGSQKSFLVAITAMVLAVTILTLVLTVADSLRTALTADTKSLLGGDLEVKLVSRNFTEEEIGWFTDNSQNISHIVTTRAIARSSDNQQLVYLKSVDQAYPLLGNLELKDNIYSWDMLEGSAGTFPAIVSPELRELLGLTMGDVFQVGLATLKVAGFISNEPDPNTRIWVSAPPVIISHQTFAESNLEQPGSIIRRRIRVMLPKGVDEATWINGAKKAFPKANWEIENQEEALSNFSRILNRLETFLTLASLGTILIAGIGIGNTVSTYLASRLGTIATLKSLGATALTIRTTYLIQIGSICLIGAGIGAGLGSALTLSIAPVLSSSLPLEVKAQINPLTVMSAALYAIMSSLIFALPPLYRFSLTNPTLLFSPTSLSSGHEPPAIPMQGRAVPAVIALLLIVLLFLSIQDERIFHWTIIGGMLVLLLFGILAHALSKLAGHITSASLPVRLAFQSVSRSPLQLRVAMVSFGITLTALTTLLLTQSNLDAQLDSDLREKSPSFYLIGVQEFQKEDLVQNSHLYESANKLTLLPFIRGRITKLAGVPIEEIEPTNEYRWVLDNDRGITWVEPAVEDGFRSTARDLVSKEWLASSTESARLQVSFDKGAAEAFELGLGDTISFALEDREFEAEITDLRPIDWRDLKVNFLMVFSHSEWEDIPSGYLGGIHLGQKDESIYQSAITKQFPNITLISTRAIFATAERMIGNINAIINVITLVAVLTGLLVMGTTVVEGQQLRTMQLVIMRVLGASNAKLFMMFCVEFIAMAAVTTLPAILLGCLAASLVIIHLFELSWGMNYQVATSIVVSMVLTSIVAGITSMRSCLNQSILKYLRN